MAVGVEIFEMHYWVRGRVRAISHGEQEALSSFPSSLIPQEYQIP